MLLLFELSHLHIQTLDLVLRVFRLLLREVLELVMGLRELFEGDVLWGALIKVLIDSWGIKRLALHLSLLGLVNLLLLLLIHGVRWVTTTAIIGVFGRVHVHIHPIDVIDVLFITVHVAVNTLRCLIILVMVLRDPILVLIMALHFGLKSSLWGALKARLGVSIGVRGLVIGSEA